MHAPVLPLAGYRRRVQRESGEAERLARQPRPHQKRRGGCARRREKRRAGKKSRACVLNAHAGLFFSALLGARHCRIVLGGYVRVICAHDVCEFAVEALGVVQ